MWPKLDIEHGKGLSCCDCKYEVSINDTGIDEIYCNAMHKYTDLMFNCLMGDYNDEIKKIMKGKWEKDGRIE